MKTLLAIPCYNCEQQVERVIQDLNQKPLSEIDEIIFINNQSSDETRTKIIETFKGNGSLIDNKRNYGLGGTFKLVHQYATENSFDSFIFFHGDDQASVHDIPTMIKRLKDDKELSAILGARFMPTSQRSNYSVIRTLGNKFFNLLFSLATFRKVYEIGSGLNIYKVNALSRLDIQKWPNHIAFDVNILLGLVRAKLPFAFSPISWREKDQTSNASNVSTGLIVLGMLIKWCLRIENKSDKWQTNFEYDKIPL